jgi:DNA invertase Pin-like site-specific DNA recombinase
MAAVAEQEREAISKRTTDALAAAKAQGVLLGSARPGHWEGREDRRAEGQRKATEQSRIVRKEQAREAMADLLPCIQQWRLEGLSLQAIATKLNEEGHTTRRGKQWFAQQVKNVLALG